MPDALSARIRARITVTKDNTISDGAARLYCLLDDYAREKGECWPSQRTLARELDCTIRLVQYRLAELVQSQIVRAEIEVTGSGRRNRYSLFHRISSPPMGDEKSFVTPLQNLSSPPPSHLYMNQEIETVPPAPRKRGDRRCDWCHGKGHRPGAVRGSCPGCGGCGRVAA